MKHLHNETKYLRYYNIIVLNSKFKNRTKLQKSNQDYVYYERHHILPASLFPEYKDLKDNKWNSVLLTAREHFICHILIWKHYKSTYYTNGRIKMTHALKRLSCDGKHNAKLYQSLKVKIEHTKESKLKMSLLKLNPSKLTLLNNFFYRKGPFTEEHKMNMRGQKDKSKCPFCGLIGGTNNMQKWHFDNCIEHPMNAQRNIENRLKRTKPKPYTKIKCPHCEIVGTKGNMTRWHFDNCKLK